MEPQSDQNYWQSGPTDIPEPLPQQTEPQEPMGSTEQGHGGSAPLAWQASEFIHHEKNGTWFLGLIAVSLVLVIIDVLLIKSWTFGALIIVMTIAALVVARRPPRMLNYVLSAQGISIDDKHFSFHDFRAFGIVQEGAFYSIRIIPNKRFMPMVSVYFPTEQGEKIVDVFGSALPMQTIELDPIDKLVEKIRF